MTQSDEQESDGELERMCRQHDDMGKAARAYRSAPSELARQVFAENLLVLWHRTSRDRNVALHARLIRHTARR
jgi:hypothetical protein